MMRFCLTFLSLLVLFGALKAQSTGPEQDCFNALPVCVPFYAQPNAYVGRGTVQDIDVNISCSGGENNSVWYTFTVNQGGSLEFLITPYDTTEDYDFALFNLTGLTCADIKSGVAPEVRCNWSGYPGETGLKSGASVLSVPNYQGPKYCAPLNVNTGETYVLMIDNFVTQSDGYTLDFSNGTADIYDTIPPYITDLQIATCEFTDSLTISLSENVVCSEIAADGSDFYIDGPDSVVVVGATGGSCGFSYYTQQITIYTLEPFDSNGTYTLYTQVGSDSNIFSDLCGNSIGFVSEDFYVSDVVEAGFVIEVDPNCGLDNVVLSNISLGNVVDLTWFFGDGFTSYDYNTVHTYPQAGTYDITLAVGNSECQDTLVQSVDVLNLQATEHPLGCSPVFIPNAFTPNNDGLHDYFTVNAENILTYEIWIFNRWGELMYHSTELDEGWDGVWHDTPQGMDVYTYQIIVTDAANQRVPYSGNLTLIR